MRVISMSLFGDSPRYLKPALRSARNVGLFYPGWQLVIYVDHSVPSSVIRQLEDHGSLVVYVDETMDANGMFWRFKAVNIPGVKTVVFRDADSDLSSKEAAAVFEWLDSGRLVHIMRDHPFQNYPILGGMFGVVNSHKIRSLLDQLGSRDLSYGEDISALTCGFLSHIPVDQICTHDELFDYAPDARNFQTGALLGPYIGEVSEQRWLMKFALRAVRAFWIVRVALLGRLSGKGGL